MEQSNKASREQRNKKKRKKKIEFSKLIFAGVSIMTISVVIFSCRMIYITGDLSPLAYLIPSVFTELATATGFYYRKAQKENEIKLPHYIADQSSTGSDEAAETNNIQ
jgi:hypothetical protein